MALANAIPEIGGLSSLFEQLGTRTVSNPPSESEYVPRGEGGTDVDVEGGVDDRKFDDTTNLHLGKFSSNISGPSGISRVS